ncbi:MAG: 4a-hydroxytetrahydrobiopterin dehydratase [Planctomycetota bacterium]
MTSIPEHCVEGARKLSKDEIAAMLGELEGEWGLKGDTLIARRATLADFAAALALVNEIGALAEAENHHPDLAIKGYRNVEVQLSTHDVDGLSANDFALARQIDALVARASG